MLSIVPFLLNLIAIWPFCLSFLSIFLNSCDFRYPFNLLLLNFGVICIIECINIIFSVLYIMTQPWSFGQWPCNLNSYFMELVPMVYAIILLSIVIDRYIALRDPSKYKKHPGLSRQKCFIVIYWILAMVAVSPIAAGLIASWPFPDRYSCQVRKISVRKFKLKLILNLSFYLSRKVS